MVIHKHPVYKKTVCMNVTRVIKGTIKKTLYVQEF